MVPPISDIALQPHDQDLIVEHGRRSTLLVIGTTITTVILICLSAGLLLTGCNDGCGCDLPRSGRDWLIEVELGHIPDEISGYPIFVDVHLQVSNMETGGVAPYGLVAVLSISPGSFSTGQTVIEIPLVDGRASSTIQIDAAGVHVFTVAIQGEDRSVTTTFSVGP